MSMNSTQHARNAKNKAANCVQKMVDNAMSARYIVDMESKQEHTMSKLFTIAGTSVLNGVETFRFATGTVEKRAWVLKHNGHTNVALVLLPNEMDKLGAIAWLQAQGIGNGAVLPNAPKAPKAAEVEVAPEPVKTLEELAAEAKAQKAAEFKQRMADAKAKKAAERAAAEEAQKEDEAQQDDTVYVEPTLAVLQAWV